MDEGGKDLRAKLKMFVSGLHGHLQPLEITEDQENSYKNETLRKRRPD